MNNSLELGKKIIKEKIPLIPKNPGIYRMISVSGEILYIGKAKNIPNRLKSYVSETNLPIRTERMLSLTHNLEVTTTNNESEALLLEANLIKKHKPRFNILLRDDKSFPYIYIGHKDKWPQLTKLRGKKSRNGYYFGPFASIGSANWTIKILQKISNAKVIGDKLGSTELKFIPGEIKNLELIEDVKTAGSISLILQVLIPVVSISQKKLSLVIKGGTDVMWSPTMNYTKYVLKEAYSRMGIKFEIQITKRGYYPKGEGEIKLEVFPSEIKSKKVSKRKKQKLQLKCSFSKIPIQIIEKKIDAIKEEIQKHNFEIEIEIEEEEATDSGSSVLIYSVDENSIIGIDGLFNKKTQNFDLNVKEIFDNSFGMDKNMADMLVVPASLGSDKTKFEVQEITKHLETNLFVTSKITGCKYGIGKISDGYQVIIEGISNSSIK